MGKDRSDMRAICLTLVLTLIGAPACAQNAATQASTDEQIASLIQQLRALQQETSEMREKIKALEAAQQPSTLQADSPAIPASVLAQSTSEPMAQPAPEKPPVHELAGIRWKGFGGVDYKALNQRVPELGTYGFNPGSAANFYTGDFNLFLLSKLSEKTNVLADLAFEESDSQRYGIDVRQALLKYDANEHLRFAFGRYQTGIGYYNWAFRSAAWLQTAADRPLVMEYSNNGGLLPTQAVGVSITGSIPSRKWGLNYIAEYGSSDTTRPDINGSGLLNDENDGNHVLVGLFSRPDAFPALQIGGSFFHDKISDSLAGPNVHFGQTIINAYVVYAARSTEFLNEGFMIRHRAVGSPLLFDTPAFYTQFSRKVGPVHPFFRYQYVNASPNNSLYDDVQLRHGPSVGARYDLNEYLAFKAQVDETFRRNAPTLGSLHLQLAFTF